MDPLKKKVSVVSVGGQGGCCKVLDAVLENSECP